MSESARRPLPGPSPQEVRALLLNDYERLASDLTGTQPERRRRLNDPLRFPDMGGFEIHTHGPKAGSWYSFSESKGGGPIELVQHFKGGDFRDAMKFSKGWLGISDDYQPKPPDPAVLAAREAAQARRVAEAGEVRQQRLDRAGKLWSERTDIEGTVADRYLTETRGIPRPAEGWPESIAYHPGRKALLLAATNDAGELRGVHAVHLTRDAEKITPEEAEGRNLAGVKASYGVLTEGSIRFPGSGAGPVLHGEGPETGLSAWAATGHETRLALSGIGRLEPDAGRRTVLLRDDDKPDSPAARVLDERVMEWRAAGKDVVSASPWPEPRGDKSDFNDLIKAGGADAVRSRIDTALTREVPKMPDTSPEPPFPLTQGLSEDGRMALGAVTAKIDREWADRTPQEREALKEQAVKSMAAHEAENGDVTLTPEQRRAVWRDQNITQAANSDRSSDPAAAMWIKQAGRDQSPEAPKADPSLSWRDSDAILRSFYIENQPTGRFYYNSHKDAEPAIIATADKVQGIQSDARTVRAVLAIAEARGWKDVEIGGGKEHAQELWIEAKARGMNAKGYEATPRDMQEAERRAAARTIRQTPEPPKEQTQDPAQSMWPNREGGKERQRNR